MTLAALLCGALFGLGATLLVRALAGTTTSHEAADDNASTPLTDRFEHLGLRIALAASATVAIIALTGWPVGALLAGAGGFFSPSLLGGKARRQAAQAHLEAIASWTEQLRDVMAAAAGLEQAIIATAPHTPAPIRPDVAWLAAAIESGTNVRTALRRFAQRLDDPAGDLVVAALILAAEGSARQLGDLLSRLAATTRDTVKMRLRIDTGRARVRSSVKLVTTVTFVFSTAVVVLNPNYVAAYRSAAGQLVLILVAALFAGAYWWLAKSARPAATARFLATAPSANPVPAGAPPA